MSVFIPGMEMPKDCDHCDLYSDCWCFALGPDWRKAYNRPFAGKRLDDCPLVEVKTPHGRLIDADAFEDAFIRYYLNQERQDHLMFAAVEIKQHLADMIADFPTIIEAKGGGEDG